MDNDLISREALKAELSKRLWFVSSPQAEAQAIKDIIDNAPIVDIKDQIAGAYNEGYMCGNKEAEKSRTQGEWARHDEWRNGEYIGGFYHVNCPCEDGYYSKWRTNFCPNCGLPMQKGGAE